jgi:hypothetical protein
MVAVAPPVDKKTRQAPWVVLCYVLNISSSSSSVSCIRFVAPPATATQYNRGKVAAMPAAKSMASRPRSFAAGSNKE